MIRLDEKTAAVLREVGLDDCDAGKLGGYKGHFHRASLYCHRNAPATGACGISSFDVEVVKFAMSARGENLKIGMPGGGRDSVSGVQSFARIEERGLSA